MILVSDHGPHSAEKWADATAQQVFPVDPNVEGDRLFAARRVQLKIAEALLEHHQGVMDDERAALDADPASRFVVGLHDVHDAATDALQAVVEAVKGSPWEDKTRDPVWCEVVYGIIGTHFADVQHLERLHRTEDPSQEPYRLHYTPSVKEV